jgi:hypothetical protein
MLIYGIRELSSSVHVESDLNCLCPLSICGMLRTALIRDHDLLLPVLQAAASRNRQQHGRHPSKPALDENLLLQLTETNLLSFFRPEELTLLGESS